MRNKVGLLHRTLREILPREARAGHLTERDAQAILDAHADADRILDAAVAQAEAIAQDSGLTEAGKQRALAKVGDEARAKLIKPRAKIAAALREHREFAARAPFMDRDANGLFVDTREQRGKDDPMAAVLRELQDRDRRDHLRGMAEPERERLLRQIADSGVDPDGLLDTAKRAPSFLGLMGEHTRQYVTVARLRHSGLDVALAQSDFAAARFAQLDAAITGSLEDLGVPAERETPIHI
jgi:hypothetical protein